MFGSGTTRISSVTTCRTPRGASSRSSNDRTDVRQLVASAAAREHDQDGDGDPSHGRYGGATPQPQRGTGACSTTSAPGCEFWSASRDPHSA